MGILRPVGFLVLIILLALLGAFLFGADQLVLGAIFMGMAFFFILAGAAFALLWRYDKHANKQRQAESRLLFFFRRWLMRVDGKNYQYLILKYRGKNHHVSERAYLEEFIPGCLVELRQELPDSLELTDVGVLQHKAGKAVDPFVVLGALKRLGWDIYFISQATSGQLYAYYYLKREVSNLS
jgi:hypothetical protein